MSFAEKLERRIAHQYVLLTFAILAMVVGIFVYLFSDLRNIAFEMDHKFQSLFVEEGKKHLQANGEKYVTEKAYDIAKQISLHVSQKPGRYDRQAMIADTELRELAIQKVGDTGYTCLYEATTGVMLHHPNVYLVNSAMENLREKLPQWWDLFQRSLAGHESIGYYKWREANGDFRNKFMAMVPVPRTNLMLAATIYEDDFFKNAQALAARSETYVDKYSQDLTFLQWRTMSLGAIALLVAILFAIFVSRRLSRLAGRQVKHQIDTFMSEIQAKDKAIYEYETQINRLRAAIQGGGLKQEEVAGLKGSLVNLLAFLEEQRAVPAAKARPELTILR